MDNSESLLPDASTVNDISRGSLINMKKIGAGKTAHTHTLKYKSALYCSLYVYLIFDLRYMHIVKALNITFYLKLGGISQCTHVHVYLSIIVYIVLPKALF